MSTRVPLDSSLTPQALELVAQQLATGRFSSTSEVVLAALQGLDDRAPSAAADIFALADGFGEGFYAVDTHWRIVLFNAEAGRYFGMDPAQAIGAGLWDLFPQAAASELGRMFFRAMQERRFVASEVESVIFPGRWLSYRLFPFRDGMGVVFRDISEWRKAERAVRASEERLRLATAAARLGLFEIDWQARTRFWSPELCQILRVSDGTDLSADATLIERILPEPHCTRFREKLAASLDPAAASDIEDEHPIVRLDGSDGWIHLNGKTFFQEIEGIRTPVRTVGLVLDITERKRAEETDAFLASVVRSSRDAIISLDREGTIRAWNRGAERLYGYAASEVIGTSMGLLAPGTLGAELDARIGEVLAGEEIDFETVRQHRSGRLVPVQISASPMYTPEGEVIGLSAVHRDISERKQHDEHMDFTLRELSHRTKNVLAVVQAIARQIGARSRSTVQFQERLSSSIQALAWCHDLLIEQGWRGAALDRLVALQLSAFGAIDGVRLSADGPPIILKPNAAQLIGLALHELATNAAKYGALSTPAGAVAVDWRRGEGGALTLAWREQGGPRVTPPRRKGFGHTVLERTASALGGEAAYAWRPEGVVWTIGIPAAHLLMEGPEVAVDSA
jgi:PAS domain S-box-containing protein